MGHILTTIIFFVKLVGLTSINPAGVDDVVHMQRTFFRFMAEHNVIVGIGVIVLLNFFGTRLEVVKTNTSIGPCVSVGSDRFCGLDLACGFLPAVIRIVPLASSISDHNAPWSSRTDYNICTP